MHGYAAATAEFGRDRNSDLATECENFWQIITSKNNRSVHLYFFRLNSRNLFEFVALGTALPMIYICGTRVVSFKIGIGKFVMILSAWFAIMGALKTLMENLLKWPHGYEGVLRCAQIINNSDLKSAYQDFLTTALAGDETFLREIDFERLIRIDPSKLRMIDIRRIRCMKLENLAPIERQRLQTLGVDFQTMVKICLLTKIVEQLQRNLFINASPNKPADQEQNKSPDQEPLLPQTKSSNGDFESNGFGQIWPGGAPPGHASVPQRVHQYENLEKRMHGLHLSVPPVISGVPSQSSRGSRWFTSPSGPPLASAVSSQTSVRKRTSLNMASFLPNTRSFLQHLPSTTRKSYLTSKSETQGESSGHSDDAADASWCFPSLTGLPQGHAGYEFDFTYDDERGFQSEESEDDDGERLFSIEDLEREAERLLERLMARQGSKAFDKLLYRFHPLIFIFCFKH